MRRKSVYCSRCDRVLKDRSAPSCGLCGSVCFYEKPRPSRSIIAPKRKRQDYVVGAATPCRPKKYNKRRPNSQTWEF